MLNITAEDKKIIARNYAKQKETVDSLRKSGRFVLGGSIFTSCLIAALVLLGGPIMLVYSLIEIVLVRYVISTFNKANNITRNCLNGKITLKEFKTLLKDKQFQALLLEQSKNHDNNNQQETSILGSYQYGTLADKHKPTKGSILGSYKYGTTANIENNEENNNSNNNENNNYLTM